MRAPRVTLKWNGPEALAGIEAKVQVGIARAAADVQRYAIGRAPRGKGSFGKSERIQAVSARFAGLSNREIAKFAAQAERKGKNLQDFRGDFQLARGGLEAPAPDRLVLERGFIRGQRKNKHLADSIELTGPTKQGHRVSYTVMATVRHAAPIEYGFQHKGGWKNKTGKTTAVAARPFMRPARAAVAARMEAGGLYFKG